MPGSITGAGRTDLAGPLAAAMLVGAIAQSPIMLPFHVLRSGQKLMTVEYWCLLSFDWEVIDTVPLLSFYILAAVCIEVVIRISLIVKCQRRRNKVMQTKCRFRIGKQ